MDEQYVTHIVLRRSGGVQQPGRPQGSPVPYTDTDAVKYSERETAAASHVGIRAIRRLRALGLIEGEETGGGLRYSEEEVIQVRRMRRLQHDLGVNLAGVEVILRLLKRLEVLQEELEQERNKE